MRMQKLQYTFICVFHACHGLTKVETWDDQERFTREDAGA